MADPQFEEFSSTFDKLPQYIKATPQCYQIVHDIDAPVGKCLYDTSQSNNTCASLHETSKCCSLPTHDQKKVDICFVGHRKRRKLPQIPLDKEPLSRFKKWPRVFRTFAIAEDSNTKSHGDGRKGLTTNLYLDFQDNDIKSYLRLQPNGHQTNCEGEVLDALRNRGCTDVDSGHSSSHSPDGVKDTSIGSEGLRSYSSSSTISSALSLSALQLQDATHRGLYKFLPRHSDEIEIDIGDPIYVCKEADDHWFEGTNLKTGCKGIFPSAYVTDVEYSDFDPDGLKVKTERYVLEFLGSLEVSHHKGNRVLLQAIQKVIKSEEFEERDKNNPCILEISDIGLRMIDRFHKSEGPSHDFFFNLKNVTFCGYHPFNHRYFGFITKHPLKPKFACHVFKGQLSTRDVAEAVGRAFQRFYQKFVETMYPVEDIYLE